MLIDDFNKILDIKVNQIKKETTFNLRKNISYKEKDFKYYHELLISYIAFKKRILPRIPLNIAFSREIYETLLSPKITNECIDCLEDICHDILRGNDLKPYQSRSLDKWGDTLFNYWNINHLHLSNKQHPKRKYLKSSSDYILLFIYYNRKVYLVDIVNHPHSDEWFKDDYFEIVLNNWPFIYTENKMRSVSGVVSTYKNQERYELAKRVTILSEMGGNVYIPSSLGVSTNGAPLSSIFIADEIIKTIKNIEENGLNETFLEENGYSKEDKLFLSLKLINDELFLYDNFKDNYFNLNFGGIFI